MDSNANEGARGDSPAALFVITAPRNEGKESATHVEHWAQESRSEMSERRYPIMIEKTGTGYSAYSPDVEGCAAIGDTADETRRNFQDALAAHFEAMREVGEPIPEPHSSVDYVEVAA